MTDKDGDGAFGASPLMRSKLRRPSVPDYFVPRARLEARARRRHGPSVDGRDRAGRLGQDAAPVELGRRHGAPDGVALPRGDGRRSDRAVERCRRRDGHAVARVRSCRPGCDRRPHRRQERGRDPPREPRGRDRRRRRARPRRRPPRQGPDHRDFPLPLRAAPAVVAAHRDGGAHRSSDPPRPAAGAGTGRGDPLRRAAVHAVGGRRGPHPLGPRAPGGGRRGVGGVHGRLGGRAAVGRAGGPLGPGPAPADVGEHERQVADRGLRLARGPRDGRTRRRRPPHAGVRRRPRRARCWRRRSPGAAALARCSCAARRRGCSCTASGPRTGSGSIRWYASSCTSSSSGPAAIASTTSERRAGSRPPARRSARSTSGCSPSGRATRSGCSPAGPPTSTTKVARASSPARWRRSRTRSRPPTCRR